LIINMEDEVGCGCRVFSSEGCVPVAMLLAIASGESGAYGTRCVRNTQLKRTYIWRWSVFETNLTLLLRMILPRDSTTGEWSWSSWVNRIGIHTLVVEKIQRMNDCRPHPSPLLRSSALQPLALCVLLG